MDYSDLNSWLQNVVTLFRPPDNAAQLWVGECSGWGILAWPATARLTELVLPGNCQFDEARKRIQKEMSDGVIVAVSSNQSSGYVRIVSDSRGAPRRLLKLSPGGAVDEMPASETVRYEPGDHFIIPVNSDADEALGRLRQDLKWLRPDQERGVYHMIARPSIELRMQRLEVQMLEVKKAAKPAETARGNAPTANGQTVSSSIAIEGKPFPVPYSSEASRSWWPLTTLMTGILTGVAVFLLGGLPLLFYLRSRTPEVTVLLDTSSFLETMSKATTRSDVQNLYQEQQLDSLPSRAPKQVLKNASFASMIPKLVLLHADIKLPDPDDHSPVAISESLRKMDDPKISRSERALIAYLSCQAFSNPNFGTEVPIAGETACKSPDTDKQQEIQKSWNELSKFIASAPKKTPAKGPFELDAAALLKALSTAGEPFKTLYEGHHLKGLLDPITDQNFAKAVIKLELYHLKLITNTKATEWGSPAALGGTIAILEDKAATAQITQGHNELLGYLVCQAFHEPRIDVNGDPLKIPGVTSCENPNATHVKNGFVDLTGFVK